MLIMTIVLSLVLLISNVYILAYYCHPDDRGTGAGWVGKFVVVIGMTLAWAQVLMLPLDVSNTRGFGGDIRMDVFWMIIYLTTAIFIIVIIPTFSYFYEADPDWSCWEKVKYSLCYLFVTIFVCLTILLVSYAFLSVAEVPIKTVNCSIVGIQNSNSVISKNNFKNCIFEDTNLEIAVSFPIYVIGILSFVSWFLFVIFGGIGLPALPLDFIYDFCTRPKKVSGKELVKMKDDVAKAAKNFEAIGLECQDMEKQEIKKKGCKYFIIV